MIDRREVKFNPSVSFRHGRLPAFEDLGYNEKLKVRESISGVIP
jgi:hypothetical protein